MAVVVGATAALVTGMGFLAGWAASGGLRRAMDFPGAVTSVVSRTPLSPAGERVASGLRCPCGCPDLLLACDCQNARGATEIKRYIMELLANGRSEADARIELINRYGAAIQRVGR